MEQSSTFSPSCYQGYLLAEILDCQGIDKALILQLSDDAVKFCLQITGAFGDYDVDRSSVQHACIDDLKVVILVDECFSRYIIGH